MGTGVVGRIEGHFLVTLCVGDLTVHLVGQVPQEANAVLHKLAKDRQFLKMGIQVTEMQEFGSCVHKNKQVQDLGTRIWGWGHPTAATHSGCEQEPICPLLTDGH